MDGVMQALANKQTEWNKDLYLVMKFARQKLSKYYTDVTSTTGVLLIGAHILELFWKLASFRKWHKGIDINPGDKTSYTTQSQESYL
jgi:hypothetical protein